MLGKIICFAIGVWCGIALMSIFALAGKADEHNWNNSVKKKVANSIRKPRKKLQALQIFWEKSCEMVDKIKEKCYNAIMNKDWGWLHAIS